jgi:hypothetical protein
MQSQNFLTQRKTERQVQLLIIVIMTGLVISGLTAFPIQHELQIAHRWISTNGTNNLLSNWIATVHKGVTATYEHYPFMAYGTDWLAFAHIMIAVAFIGPLRDPVRNIWVIEFGLIASAAIFPLALIAGSLREIPFQWQLIDCSFGLVAGTLLLICYQKIKTLEKSRVSISD